MLENLEPTSPTWRAVAAWAEREIEMYRSQLENDLTPEQTAKIRGRIKELRSLLLQAEPPQSARRPVGDPVPYT
jgi:hypothetical protein